MTITTRDHLVNAMLNNATRIVIEKASIANAAVAQNHSLWRATGQPGQGTLPTTTVACTHTTTGAISFAQQTAPAGSVFGIFEAICTNAGTTLEIHDRLAHMGGLSGTVLTAQTANVDLNALTTNNLPERIGDSNFSDVQWWLEWYTDTGGSASTATVNVTYNDGTSGNLTGIALGATRRASFMQGLNYLIPAADSGKYIRDVNTVTLSTTTGAAGNFGVTATRYKGSVYQPVASARFKEDYFSLGVPDIPNESCLFAVQIASTTTTGIVRATGKIAHG